MCGGGGRLGRRSRSTAPRLARQRTRESNAMLGCGASARSHAAPLTPCRPSSARGGPSAGPCGACGNTRHGRVNEHTPAAVGSSRAQLAAAKVAAATCMQASSSSGGRRAPRGVPLDGRKPVVALLRDALQAVVFAVAGKRETARHVRERWQQQSSGQRREGGEPPAKTGQRAPVTAQRASRRAHRFLRMSASRSISAAICARAREGCQVEQG